LKVSTFNLCEFLAFPNSDEDVLHLWTRLAILMAEFFIVREELTLHRTYNCIMETEVANILSRDAIESKSK
jgi:hypothetical protein